MLSALLAEVRLALEAGDLPVGAAFTVGETLVSSHHNTIFSQAGQHFHAERNLLGSLEGVAIPAGRRILWVTLEPCVRCAKAIARFGVDEVVYVLDDPFESGKALLAKAGIAVNRRTAWEEETLRLVMEAFSRLPELCAWKQFPYFLSQWQRYACLEREEQLRLLFRHHLASYLYQKMPFLTHIEKAEHRGRFLAEEEALVALTLQESATAPTLAFVRDLHRALFPPGHRLRAVGNDGITTETGSGEWRRHVLWPRHAKFSALESIEADLASLLEQVAAKAAFRREDALQFFFDFTIIQPFTDGNHRLAAILADLLCLHHGLVPVALDHKNPQLNTVLLERAFADNAAPAELLALVDGWNQGGMGIKPRALYDDHPAVYHTYTKRIDNKMYVVERILAKLSGRPLASPLVITDLGAGMGLVADGLLHALAQQEGLDFTYHYLEPSQTSVDHFRATSRYAALPQVVVHAMGVEEFLLPPSDLIIAVQSIQYSANREEALHDMLSALKPGGLALVVNNHLDSEELRMSMALGVANGQLSALLKVFLEQARCDYEEELVESSVRISPADRDTPEGDDLLAWYLRQLPASLSPARNDAFWQVVARHSKEGLLPKKESFFWIEAGGGELTFAETITACLLPRFLHLHGAKPEEELADCKADFLAHARRLSKFLRRELVENTLSPATAIGLHTLLYPPGAVIQTRDGNGNLVAIPPGAWRQREIIPPGLFPATPWYSIVSPTATIEEDLGRIIAAFNQISNPRREDILRFYFLFLKVHPFADSNGATAALLADALCVRHGHAPLVMLHHRFNGKAFHRRLFAAFEANQSDPALAEMLREIDGSKRGSC